eukprot:PhF_6_TR840/c0_g1_i1/m.1267
MTESTNTTTVDVITSCLKREIESAKSENKALRCQVEALQHANSILRSKAEHSIAEGAILEQMRLERDTALGVAQQMSVDLTSLRTTLGVTQTDLSARTAELHTARLEINMLTDSVTNLKRTVEILKSEVSGNTSKDIVVLELQTKERNLMAENSHLQQELRIAQTAVEEMKEEFLKLKDLAAFISMAQMTSPRSQQPDNNTNSNVNVQCVESSHLSPRRPGR